MNDHSMQVSLLRQLAKSAKQRLKTQNYQGDDAQLAHLGQGGRPSLSTAGGFNLTKTQITIKLLDESCQTEFCKRVRYFLEHIDHTKIVNPISQLADKEYMSSLSALERQRYIFDIAERYNKIKDEYYNEQIMFNA